MRVVLDVNILGRGFLAEVSRTGIFRATEGFVGAMLPVQPARRPVVID